MFDLARKLISMSLDMGVQFGEARVVDQTQQIVNSADGKASISEIRSYGFGIRVLVDGHWGFASANLSHQDQADQVVKRAISLARAMPKRSRTARLAQVPVVKDSFETTCQQDPFGMPISEKVEFVQSITRTMSAASDLVSRTRASLDFRRETCYLVTSEGTEIKQTLTMSGLAIAVVVEKNGQVFQRAYPDRHGDLSTGGFERVLALKPMEAAKQMVPEAIELLNAPSCEPQITTVILDPTMLGLVIHETVGHPTELDRALGDESDNFGPSFLGLHMLGNFRYGSELVTIVADATRPGAVATYGYDHEGVKAQRFPLIERGIFTNYLMSRECAADLGLCSNGTARASSWNRIPMARLTNLCLLPGNSTKEQLISETDEGLYIETAKGADIDDKRLTFSFIGERGWQIKNGRIVGLVKNPVIYGETPSFWRNCTGIAGPEEDHVTGLAGCGKGQPWQHIPTGQGGPPTRFEGIKVGGA